MNDPVVGDRASEDRSPVEELRQSIALLALLASSMTTYIAIGVIAVRLLSSR